MLPALSSLSFTLHALPFALSALINLTACGVLGGYILTRSKNDPALLLFALYNLCAALWSLFYLLWQLSGNSASATLFTRLLIAFATFLPLLYFLFVRRFLSKATSPLVQGCLWVLFGGFAALCLFSRSIVGSIAPRGGFPFWPVAGPLLTPLLALWFAVLLMTLFLLVQAARQTSSPRRRGQMLALLAGNIIAYAGGATNFFLWYDVPVAPWGNSAVLVVPLATLYAIAVYRLFDLRLIIKLALVYTGMLSVLLLIYALPTAVVANLVGQRGSFSLRDQLINITATVLTGLLIAPLYPWLNATTERFLFQKDHRRQMILLEQLRKLGTVNNLDDALEMILNGLRDTFELSQIAVVLFPDEASGQRFDPVVRFYIRQLGYTDSHSLDEDDLQVLRDCFSAQAYLPQGSRSLVRLTISRSAFSKRMIHLPWFQEDPNMAHTPHSWSQVTMNRLGAEVATPLYEEKKLIGMLLLSPKRQETPFRPEELSLIDLAAAQTVSAIQKARLFKEDQSKGEFVSMATQELLIPISAMDGYMKEVLEHKQGRIDEQARGYLGNVYISVKRLASLVKDMLSASRIENGRMSFEPEEVDLTKLVKESIAQLLLTAQDKGLKLQFKPQKVPSVWVDPERMMQVMINLLSNAIKYTPDGYVTVTITSSSRLVLVSVKDTGLGMSREQRKQLFQKFSRITTSKTAGIPGNGLGLYITNSMVEKMGGKISVMSSPGKGSTFTVAFPIGPREPVRGMPSMQ